MQSFDSALELSTSNDTKEKVPGLRTKMSTKDQQGKQNLDKKKSNVNFMFENEFESKSKLIFEAKIGIFGTLNSLLLQVITITSDRLKLTLKSRPFLVHFPAGLEPQL